MGDLGPGTRGGDRRRPGRDRTNPDAHTLTRRPGERLYTPNSAFLPAPTSHVNPAARGRLGGWRAWPAGGVSLRGRGRGVATRGRAAGRRRGGLKGGGTPGRRRSERARRVGPGAGSGFEAGSRFRCDHPSPPPAPSRTSRVSGSRSLQLHSLCPDFGHLERRGPRATAGSPCLARSPSLPRAPPIAPVPALLCPVSAPLCPSPLPLPVPRLQAAGRRPGLGLAAAPARGATAVCH